MKQIQIDLDKATAFDLPDANNDLTAVSFKTPDGKQGWVIRIPGSRPIATPAYADGMIFVGGGYGSHKFYAIDAETGRVVWQKQNSGASAPLVAGGHVVTTSKEVKDGKAYEGLKRLDLKGGKERDREMLAKEKAEYLKENKGGGVAMKAADTIALDSSVGFSSAPSSAKLKEANQHIGVSTVAGAWAYQGSRAAYRNGHMMNAQGKYLNSIRSGDGKFAWRAEVKGKDIGDDTQVFSPPALGANNLYLCSAQGHLVAVKQEDGALTFAYALKHPMAFQPALANGNIYAGTTNGLLICLKTDDRDADGWYAWGGNAQHNKQ